MLLTSTENTTETAQEDFELNKKKQLHTATIALSHPKQVLANICRPSQRIKEIKNITIKSQ